MRYLLVLFLLSPSIALAQPNPPPGDFPRGSPADPARGCEFWYPPELQRAGVTGTTVVSFHILVSGLVNQVAIVESSGNADLDKAALHCAAQWKYKPARRGNQPVEVTQTAKIVWQLPEVAPPSSEPAPPEN
ncbi:MAG TPA: energy transducer TonB [Rhizomicrobium sp.]|nr:energy transducer TonB [Rhizomicrobium sp.]